MDSLPADIVVLLFELLCGKKHISEAVSSLVAVRGFNALVRTSKRFRDIAYKHVIRNLIDTGTIKYCMKDVDYYKKIGAIPKQGHLALICSLSHVINEICLPSTYELIQHMLTLVDDDYLVKEAPKVNTPSISNKVKILLAKRHPLYLEKAWRVVTQKERGYGHEHVKELYSIRDSQYPDVRLYETPLKSYQSILDSRDYDLAYRCVIENISDVRYYSNAVANFIIAISHSGPQYPWLNESEAVVLMNRVLAECNFIPEWFATNAKQFRVEYNVYFSVRYGIPLQVHKIDNVALVYLLGSNPPHSDLVKIIGYNALQALLIFHHIPCNQFSIKDLITIAKLTLHESSVRTLLFSDPYFEPSTHGWCFDNYFDKDVKRLCREYNLTEDETAIVGIYVAEAAKAHRVCFEKMQTKVLSHSVPKKTNAFEKWVESRKTEGWSIHTNIEKFIKERDEGLNEQQKIDKEQETIRLNWSRDKFNVPQWDEYDLMCSGGSGDEESNDGESSDGESGDNSNNDNSDNSQNSTED